MPNLCMCRDDGAMPLCVQSLYEELTAWKKNREASVNRVRANVPALPGGGSSMGAGAGVGAGAAGSATGRPGGSAAAQQLMQKLVAQGYSVEEIMALAKQRPELMAALLR